MTRSYESNGPDVKIRGNAHHVAEKYLQLARDAHTSSDPVAAENYLQHAEHYFRLIAAAQAAQAQQQNGSARPAGDDSDDLEDDDDFGGLSDRFASPPERTPAPYQGQPAIAPPAPQPQPQPHPQGQPYQERAPYDNDRQPQVDRAYQGRPDRPHGRPPDRGPRDNRPYQDRQDAPREVRDNRFPRDNRPREFRPYRDPNPPREAAPSEPAASPTLPSFITAPPRANSQPDVADPQFSAPAAAVEPLQPSLSEGQTEAAPFAYGEGEPRFPARGRRRRARPNFGFDGPGDSQPNDSPDAPPQKDEAPAGE